MKKKYYSAENYNQRLYTGFRNLVFTKSHNMLEEFEFKNNIDDILEIGGGSNPHIKYIKHEFNKYHSVDLDNGQDLKKFINDNYPEISFSYYSGDKLPYNDETFSRVIISHCLEHIPYPEQFTYEMLRVLKQGGILSIALPCDPGLLWRLGTKYIELTSKIKQKFFSVKNIEISDYQNAIEHINPIFNLYIILNEKFNILKESFFPINLKIIDLNLINVCHIRK